MTIFQIAVSNLKRRKGKVLFLIAGLIVGVATVVGFLNITKAMNLELGNKIDEFGANIVILPKSEGMELSYGNTVTSNVAFDVEKLTMEDIPKIYNSSVREYINIVSPKLVGTVEIGNQKALIVGVETKQEFIQKPWFSLEKQANLKPGENVGDLALIDIPGDGLIIGSSAAKTLGAQVGDSITINHQRFHVFGILNQLGSEEDGLIYANLEVVQTLLKRPEELSMIEVSAYCNACPIEEIATGLEETLPKGKVIPMLQATLFREETIEQFSIFGYALSGMVLLIATLVVLTTMLSSVNERTREIGIFRAIGFRRSHVMKIIFIEAGTISVLGGFIGFFVGSFTAYYAGPYLAQLQGKVPFHFGLLLPSILLSIGLTILVSAYPAMKAAKLDPVEALRFI